MQAYKIELVEGCIRYSFEGTSVWGTRLSDVRIIGEVTNPNGPVVDDYFWYFLIDTEHCYEASFYADGREEFNKALSVALNHEISLRLFSSTDFNSRVLWPSQLTGKPLLTFTPILPKTWFGKLFGSWRTRQELSEEVVQFLLASPSRSE